MGLTWTQLQKAADEPVCLRTIYRDIDTITFAGFPVYVETDHNKGSRVYWRDRTVN